MRYTQRINTLRLNKKEKTASLQIHKSLMDSVRQIMKLKGYTEKDLADRMNTSQGYITRLFSGELVFRIPLLVRLGKALDERFSLQPTSQRYAIPTTISVTAGEPFTLQIYPK